ncbi:MAG TPA: nucleoid-associated protein, partial [Pyrinomonadaceae bacterium]|nr:nucleoid-associated protein [Pyrinomonadaceae bacterium]
MIDISECQLKELALSYIGKNGSSSQYPINQVFVKEPTEERFIMDLLLKPFVSASKTFEFSHEIDLKYNVVFNIARHLFQGEELISGAELIRSHLISTSVHHGIKDGEVLVASFDDVRIGDTFHDAIGIYKFESRSVFLSTEVSDNAIDHYFSNGIGNKKPEKACLIILTEEPFLVLCIDNNDGGTAYWQDAFLGISTREDATNFTSDLMNLAKDFILGEVPANAGLGKAERIDLLNQSVGYFKENSNFVEAEFGVRVFDEYKLTDQFRDFRERSYKEGRRTSPDEFEISKIAVKKQARIFKSVLKLDRNFHVYIHGNKELIQ